MTDKEKINQLREAVTLLLDQVDYTNGACGLTEMVGAVLDTRVLIRVRLILAETQEDNP